MAYILKSAELRPVERKVLGKLVLRPDGSITSEFNAPSNSTASTNAIAEVQAMRKELVSAAAAKNARR